MSIINQPASDLIAAAKQQGANIVGPITESITSGIGGVLNKGVEFLKKPLPFRKGGQGTETVKSGAMPETPSTQISFRDAFGVQKSADTRVKIRVPISYISERTQGSSTAGLELYYLGGIVFPFTPTISYEMKADYQTITPTHSNFPINFYQRSSLGNITISGKFTVQNEKDAEIYISTITLLRALTKMQTATDMVPGSPPPVCRLDAFGTDMLMNVPVAITSFRIEAAENVDYFTVGKRIGGNDITSVPVISTISVGLTPMYSRKEMMEYSVNGYISSNQLAKKGFV